MVLLPVSCFVFSGGRDASLKQFPGNGCRSNAGCSKLENELYHSSGFRVRFHSAIGAFAIPVRANFALVFAPLHFGVLGAFGLDGHIPAVILADQILESYIHTAGIALVLIAVKIIVDGNEPGVKQREHTLNEIASLNAVSPKPGKVFYDDAVDLIGPHHLNQLLDFGTLEVCPAISVVDKLKDFCIGGLRHGRNKFVQRKVLVFNAHTVVFIILQGKADIKGNYIFLHWLSTSSQCSNSLWKRKRTVIRFSFETSTRSIRRSIRAAVS